MSQEPASFALFLGRFHPLLVHLPIGGLALLGILEFAAAFTRWKDAAQNSRWILGWVVGTAVASASCGWVLAANGGYDAALLKWHRVAGIAMVGCCLLTLLLRVLDRLRAYRILLVASLLLLAIAGHLGGSLTHGHGYLTRYAPLPVRTLLAEVVGPTKGGSVGPAPKPRTLFEAAIEPILRQRCSACHGPEKRKGGLRLDTLEGLLKGGHNGPAIKAGHAAESPLIQRLRLPLNDDDHMPPDGKPQPTEDEIAVLEWWINAGAPTSATIAELNLDTRTRNLIEKVSKQVETKK